MPMITGSMLQFQEIVVTVDLVGVVVQYGEAGDIMEDTVMDMDTVDAMDHQQLLDLFPLQETP